MKRVTYILLASAAALLFAGCLKEHSIDGTNPGGGVSVPITLSCELLDDEEPIAATKSQFSNNPLDDNCDLRRITDMKYYLFSGGVLRSQQCFSNASQFAVTLPDPSLTYNLYIIANAGDITLPANTAESAIGTALSIEYTDNNYMSTIKSKGFPMAGKVEGFTTASAGDYQLKRLVYELRVDVNDESLTGYKKVTIKSVHIRQAAKNVFPFMAGGSKATAVFQSDLAQGADYDAPGEGLAQGADYDAPGEGLAQNTTYKLYMLENMRGDLLPGNEDWGQKVLRDEQAYEASHATYVEFECELEDATYFRSEAKMRAYLGKNAGNFDVERSKAGTLHNYWLNSAFTEQEFRKDLGDVTPKEINCVPTNCYDLIAVYGYPLEAQLQSEHQIDPSSFEVYVNGDNIKNTGITWGDGSYAWRTSQYIDADEIRFYPSTGKLTLSTGKKPMYCNTVYENKPIYENYTVEIVSQDGYIDKEFEFKAQRSSFDLYWVYETTGTSTVLKLEQDDYCKAFFESKNLHLYFMFRGGYLTGTSYAYGPGNRPNFTVSIPSISTKGEKYIVYAKNNTAERPLNYAITRLQNTGNINGVYPIAYRGMILTNIYIGTTLYNDDTRLFNFPLHKLEIGINDFPFWMYSLDSVCNSSYTHDCQYDGYSRIWTHAGRSCDHSLSNQNNLLLSTTPNVPLYYSEGGSTTPTRNASTFKVNIPHYHTYTNTELIVEPSLSRMSFVHATSGTGNGLRFNSVEHDYENAALYLSIGLLNYEPTTGTFNESSFVGKTGTNNPLFYLTKTTF